MKYLIALLLLCQCVIAQDYFDLLLTAQHRVVVSTSDIYVDSVAGSDNNPGTEASPYASLGKVESIDAVGKTIWLKRGSVFREKFRIPTNSTIKPYSTGARPVVSGAVVLTNANFTLMAGKTSTWQYSLFVPLDTNYYASLQHSNVLMVWDNNSRVGSKWDVNAGKNGAATVDALANSFYFDRTNGVLYVHPFDHSDPATNGRSYEASIRTLALHGGDGFVVEDLDVEKCYAFSTTGQQGYQLLGLGSGTYRRCKASYSWNHNAGVANEDICGPLIFDSCWAYDAEDQAASVPTLFVGYKNGNTNHSVVIFTNCLASMSYFSSNAIVGFYAHDGLGYGVTPRVQAQYINCVASNLHYGFQVQSNRLSKFENCVAVKCKWGAYLQDATPVIGFQAYYSTNYGILFNGSVENSMTGCKMISSYTAHNKIFAINATNCVFAATNTTGYGLMSATGNKMLVYNSMSNSFYKYQVHYMYGQMGAGSDWNNYYGWGSRIGSDMTNPPSPGYWTTLANWKTAWAPADANATQNDPGYAAGFFEYTVDDPTQ